MKNRFLLFISFITLFSCAEMNVVRPPMMGWNSWNAYMVDISDSIIMNAADLMVAKGLKDAGYNHVNIDDGFFGGRDSSGFLLVHPIRFPNGIKHVPQYIHSLGMKAGIYSDAGHNTCGSSYNKDPHGIGVGLWEHDAIDAEKYFNEWDFDFIKIDYCGARKLKLDPQKRYERIRKVFDSIAHKQVDIGVCRWAYPGTWVKNVGSSWRISHDIRPNWKSIREMVNLNLYLSAYAGNGHYNDMDMMVVGYNGGKSSAFQEDSYARNFGLTYEEEEAHFALWCIMSSPLLIGCDLTFIPEKTLQIITNKELIAINQDPLGLQAHVIQCQGESYVLAKDIIKHRGNIRAIALYNPSDEACKFIIQPETLEFKGSLKIRDLNKKKELGVYSTIEMTLPPHSAKVLKVEGKRIEPTRYEAEWGYCPDFTGINSTGVKYVHKTEASCGAVAQNIGGSATNYLEWKNVFSEKGGKYILKVRIFPYNKSEFNVIVNGNSYPICTKETQGMPIDFPLEVTLKKGNNIVKLTNPMTTLPPIDCIILEKQP